MTETAKERIYREALENVSRSLPVNSELDLAIGEALIKAKYLPDDTDKLSVEKLQEIRITELKDFNSKILQAELKNQKLQEHLNTAKKALTEISNHYLTDESYDGDADYREIAINALAAIGGDDEKV